MRTPITLACVDCIDPCAGARAMWKSMQRLSFTDAILFSHDKPGNLPPGIAFVEIPQLTSLDEYNLFMLRDFWTYVQDLEAYHVLTVQSDGFVIHPELWDPTWLQYDYIGPPWEKLRTYAEKSRVGGSGFCLRSNLLIRSTASILKVGSEPLDRHRTMTRGAVLDDIFCGWTHYDELLSRGVKFAPVDVAAKFAFEHPTMEALTPDNSFGFHSTHTEETEKFCEGIHVMVKPRVEVKKSRPVLSILIAALHERNWMRLVCDIRSQIGNNKAVELCVIADNRKATSGWKRNRLLDMASGLYVAMVDDDDEVSPNYVEALLQGCCSGKDVITFDVNRVADGQATRQSFGMHNADHAFVHGVEQMTVNHLCAWKREIALRVRYDERIGYADDQLWYKPLVACFPDMTEHHIDELLYTYLFDWNVTANQFSERMEFTRRLYTHGARVFRKGDEVFVSNDTAGDGAFVNVRTATNNVVEANSTMEYVTTVQVR